MHGRSLDLSGFENPNHRRESAQDCGLLGRREPGAYPQRSVTIEQRGPRPGKQANRANRGSDGESEPARQRWECARFAGVLPLQLAPLWSWPPSRSTAHANAVLFAVLRPVSGASGAALKAIFLLEF